MSKKKLINCPATRATRYANKLAESLDLNNHDKVHPVEFWHHIRTAYIAGSRDQAKITKAAIERAR